MQGLKDLVKNLKNRYHKKQAMFIIAAIVLFALLSWFAVANFVFIIDQLNQAFGTEVTAEKTATEFDRNAFQELNLIQ